jgi:hypothetical protein
MGRIRLLAPHEKPGCCRIRRGSNLSLDTALRLRRDGWIRSEAVASGGEEGRILIEVLRPDELGSGSAVNTAGGWQGRFS